MGHDGVNEAREEEGEDKVSAELGALGNGAASDASDSDGKGPLIEEVAVIIGAIRDVFKGEEVGTDEGVGVPEGEGKTEEVVGDTADDGIDNVGKHDVHGVLGPNGPSTEHGEAKLHYKYQVRREEEVDRVNGVGHARLPRDLHYRCPTAPIGCSGRGVWIKKQRRRGNGLWLVGQ